MKKVFEKILSILLVILTGIFVVFLNKLGVLSNNLFFILVGIITIITVVIIIFLNSKKEKTIFKILKVLSYIGTFGLIIAYSFGTYYISNTLNFVDNITVINQEVTSYYVVVLNESRYQEISDLEGVTMSYYNNTKQEVLDKIKLDLQYNVVDDYNLLLKDLYNKTTESILISDIIKQRFEEDDKEFSTKTRILKEINITMEIEDITKKVSIKNTPFNVLISGIDTFGSINQTSRNDVNMVATINPNTNKVLLTSIPRDYYVQLNGTTGYKDKLTHAGVYGLNVAVKTIEDILDIDINYYVKVNFNTVVDLVNQIGGITVYSDQALNLYGCNLIKGYNNLNGKCALAFSRERYSYVDGDRHSGRNQQEVIKAIFQKFTSASTLITQYTNILEVMDGKFATNLEINDGIDYLKYEMIDLTKYEFINQQVDGTGAMEYTNSYPHQKLSVMIPDEKTVIDAQNKIKEVMELNEVVEEGTDENQS